MEKYKVYIAFGESESDIVENEGFTEENKANWKVKSFNTEAERNAYLEGVEDMEGWLGVYWEKPN